MTDRFPGFLPPTENYSKLPHQMIDALPLIETVSEMKVILYILRHTWGFQDQWKKITLDEFERGRKDREGNRLDAGVGLSIPSIRDGLRRAEEHGFILVEIDDRDKARVKKFYSLAMVGDESLQSDCKSFTPTSKNLSIGVKDSCNRSEKETSERNHQKETEKETAALPEKQADPLSFDLERKTEAVQEREGNWSTPPDAGGTFPFADGPTDAFAEVLAGIPPLFLPSKDRQQWARKLRQIAERWSTEERTITAGDMERAIRAIPDSGIGWKTYTSPFTGNFETDVGTLLLGSGPAIQKGGSHGAHQRDIAQGAVQRQVATEEEARAILGDDYFT